MNDLSTVRTKAKAHLKAIKDLRFQYDSELRTKRSQIQKSTDRSHKQIYEETGKWRPASWRANKDALLANLQRLARKRATDLEAAKAKAIAEITAAAKSAGVKPSRISEIGKIKGEKLSFK